MNRPEWLEVPENVSRKQSSLVVLILGLGIVAGLALSAGAPPQPDTMAIISGDPFLAALAANGTVDRGAWQQDGGVDDWQFAGDWKVTSDGRVLLRPVQEGGGETSASGMGRLVFVPEDARSVAVLEVRNPAAELGIGEAGTCRDARAVVQARTLSDGGLLSGVLGGGRVINAASIVGNETERLTLDVSGLEGEFIALEGWVQAADGGCGMSNGELIEVQGLYLEAGR